ncbi:hypothetical protein GUITHDRAFT_100834 [Guillardia theta CCMP2712]|uniref:D-isomer specific 2-hydroxyacid dehydrogenase NAD-binding domain-containing protein n=1 Tax=Guillardia theta (strain CCMP2712) TaxID=905079 RepID=L1K0I1_GUITC|nr:hypothetical protein GUITHDRAFT_100834 [Guillardia theta CCMP2712]EKX53868.1 hypothetical protein GUITHDRAFT_100834 [Guillardia theta CCMP2712]|eukprot:XP_005840848.1 hypothetical protein GUITHDRAFT_100834 [Guillardia theta CCMP2712]
MQAHPRVEKSGHCRILVADKVDYKPSLGTIGIIEEGGRDVNVLVVRSTKVTADVFDSLQGLKLAGVKVANCPGANADAVAELTWGLILACDRGIVEQTGELKEGKWRKGKHSGRSRGLKGRKMGIIGFGRIGREVAARARGFGMSLVVWNRSPLKHVEEDVLVGCLFAKTCCKLQGKQMGNVIDEDALLSAMDKKNIRAGLDVFQHEPALAEANFSSKLAAHPSVVCTHHIGAATTQAQAAVGQLVVEIVKEFDRTGEVLHAVK